MLRAVCMYCKKTLGEIRRDTVDDEQISHGLCAECLHRFLAGKGKQLTEFLDTLTAPVFLVDGEGRIVGANERGRQSVSKGPEETSSSSCMPIVGCAMALRRTSCAS